ncbi:MAG: hypothetical protein LW832_05645 [Parachlamydia sp.]|jgi:hypothetical protein|nr:hypothetical protein [Parachlamydia sp.]
MWIDPQIVKDSVSDYYNQFCVQTGRLGKAAIQEGYKVYQISLQAVQEPVWAASSVFAANTVILFVSLRITDFADRFFTHIGLTDTRLGERSKNLFLINVFAGTFFAANKIFIHIFNPNLPTNHYIGFAFAGCFASFLLQCVSYAKSQREVRA